MLILPLLLVSVMALLALSSDDLGFPALIGVILASRRAARDPSFGYAGLSYVEAS